MIFYLLILMFGIMMGLAMSCGLIYANKLKEYIEGKENKNLWLKALDITWRIALPIVFVLFIILPNNLLNIYFCKLGLVENLLSIYIVSFVSTCLILLFILIKLDKIKIEHSVTRKKDKSTQHRFTFLFIRSGSIVAALILLVLLYIKQKYAYLYKSFPLLPWILIAAIFIIAIVSLWLLFNKKDQLRKKGQHRGHPESADKNRHGR